MEPLPQYLMNRVLFLAVRDKTRFIVYIDRPTLDELAMMLARCNFSDDINSKLLANNYVEEPSARGENRRVGLAYLYVI